MQNTLKKVARLWLVILISASATAAVPSSAQSQFPGPGNSADWADALPYYNLANKYVEKERYDEAVEKYREAIDRYPYDPDFFINLGFAYRKIEEYPQAESAFRSALKLNKKDWMSWSNLGNAMLKQNKLNETVAAFQEALKYAPPAAEKALILRDIQDIKKVLEMRRSQEPTGSAEGHKTGAQAKAPTKSTNQAKAEPKTKSTSQTKSVPEKKSKAVVKSASGWDEVLP